MLTLSTAGKSGIDAVNIVNDALAKSDDDELRILIDSPLQAEGIRKFLEAHGFSNVVPEDDDGILYLMATKTHGAPEEPSAPHSLKGTVNGQPAIPSRTGILITCRNKEYTSAFMKNFLSSLTKTKNKPDVIALLDAAVKIAAYNSPLCAFLKRLEASGVQVLLSEPCADRLGMTEAAGAGVIADMAEILDEIFSCGKVISI
ncbi:MAG: hypothetical protein IJG65_10055 [Synergistaceae bacterium]|nr:hypothetical protein [Synergistaceae bacterium]